MTAIDGSLADDLSELVARLVPLGVAVAGATHCVAVASSVASLAGIGVDVELWVPINQHLAML